MEKSYQTPKEELLQQLGTSENGLSSAKAEENLEKYGRNEITGKKAKNPFFIFLEQFKDFLVMILIAAAIVSAVMGDIESMIVIIAVITMNSILGTVQTVRAEKSLNSLKKLSAPNAKVIRDGKTVVIPSDEVTKGDIVSLEAGDYVCADGRIIENASLKVNESALTGESLSVEKSDETLEGELPLADRTNMVHSGTFVTYGRAKFVVTDIGMDTEVGKIAGLINSAEERKTPLQVNLDNFGKKLSIGIMVICAIVFGLSVFRGEDIMNAFLFAVALAVAAIPEALSSIVTIVLSFGTQKMSKENAIIRKLQAVEGLGSVSVICSDKTGTLTQNKMTVKKIYASEKIIDSDKCDFTDNEQKRLVLTGILCNDSVCRDGTEIGDPTETALVNFGLKHSFSFERIREKYPRLAEIPFDSDRKLMSTVHDVNGKLTMITKGAVDVLLGRMNLTSQEKDDITAAAEEMSAHGLRILAFAYKEISSTEISLSDENNLEFMGLVAMMDPPREESKQAVAECIGAGIKPVMITGDHKVTAAAIAKEIGILKDISEAAEGSEIDDLTDEQLREYVPTKSVYARVSPEHKIRIVKAWQDRGNIVAMTGDGVNDAPALKQADIGFAMGDGTAVAQEAGDVVILNNSLTSIKDCVLNSRTMAKSVGKFLIFQLTVNISTLLMNILAPILGWTEPFSIVQILWINLIMDTLAAMAFGGEPILDRYMKDQPAKRTDNILTSYIKSAIGVSAIFITIGSILILENIGGITSFVIPAGCVNPELYEKTFMFAFFIYAIIFNSLNTRSERFNLFEHIGENKKFVLVMGGIFILQTIIIEIGGQVFSTTMLEPKALLVSMALAVLIIPVDLIRKGIVRK